MVGAGVEVGIDDIAVAAAAVEVVDESEKRRKKSEQRLPFKPTAREKITCRQ